MGTLSLAGPPRAQGQNESNAAARRALLDQAEAAYERRDHARALDLAQRALQLGSSPSVRLFIAEEHAALNHFAQALGSADLCVRDAQREGMPSRHPVVDRCTRLLHSLRERVAFVRVFVPESMQSYLHVQIEDSEVPPAVLGEPYVVNPGAVRVALLSSDRERELGRTVTVRAGQTGEVRFELDEAQRLNTPSRATVVAPVPDAAPSVQPSATPAPRVRRPRDEQPAPARVSPGGPVLLGLGGAAFITAGVAFGLREAAYGDARMLGCRDSAPGELECPTSEGFSRAQSAETPTLVTNIALVSGGVFAAAGLTWLLIDVLRRPAATPATTQAPDRPSVQPAAIPLSYGGALGLTGRF